LKVRTRLGGKEGPRRNAEGKGSGSGDRGPDKN